MHISYTVSFIAGISMFFSPCILPLVPSYLSYLTGVSFKDISSDMDKASKRKIQLKAALHSLFFIIGFSAVFVLLGMSVSSFGRLLLDYQPVIKKAGAALIILFGLMIMGVLKIGMLGKTKKIEYKKESVSFLGSFLVGATFAFAWTPCVGPILGSMLVYASSQASANLGFKLLSVFSLGLAVPFFISAILINSLLAYLKRITKYIKVINVIAGIILVVFGVMILFGGIL